MRKHAELPFSVRDQTERLSTAGYKDKIAEYEHAGWLYTAINIFGSRWLRC
jgi:uncharacterized protein YllA (UPF0747 family)